MRFRLRLSQYVHNEYLKGVNFYKAINLGSEKIDNAYVWRYSFLIAKLVLLTFGAQ